jgi:hypothetical protein
MRVFERTATASTANLAGVAALQNTTAGVPLTLTASPVVMSPVRFLQLTSTANMSANLFTVVGTDRSGQRITEVVTGPNANTVPSTMQYATIISITPSATDGVNQIRAGWDAVTYSPWMPLGQGKEGSAGQLFTFPVTAGGTPNWDIEVCSTLVNRRDNLASLGDRVPGIKGDLADGVFALAAAVTATRVDQVLAPWAAVRVKINSGTANVRLRYVASFSG